MKRRRCHNCRKLLKLYDGVICEYGILTVVVCKPCYVKYKDKYKRLYNK